MTVKDDLHALVDQLDDDTTAAVLAFALWLLEEGTAPALGDLTIQWQAVPDERPRD